VLTAPPLLEWGAVRRADYFNVQVERDGKKILSRWPRKTQLQMHSEWRYRGHVRHLVPGRYKWHVWPGFGSRSAARYGPKIGSRSFVIAAVPPAQ
jgi:hypothetical protein